MKVSQITETHFFQNLFLLIASPFLIMDLSKAFDSMPHDLLTGKIYAYGFSLDVVTFFCFYLKTRKQGVRINNTHSVFRILLSGVPQGSILRPLLFNILMSYISGYKKQTC